MNIGMDVKVNGTRIKQPKECKSSRFNLTSSGRVISGKMTMELVAKKRKLELSYPVISGADYLKILSLIDTKAMFFTVTWIETDVAKTARMYVGEISGNKFRTDTGAWYWQNVEFHFIEQ